jgi:hypothetical protein
MTIVERAKNICLSPDNEWTVIAAETTSTGGLLTGYVVPLAAVGAVAGFIGGSFVGRSMPFLGTYRVPLVSGIVVAAFSVVMAVVGVFVLSLVINALAPTFGGEKNSAQAFKVAVYSYTPAWVAGVLQILPSLTVLIVLAALWALYLLYLGLPRLMKCPQDKAMGYTVVVVLCAIVMMVVISTVTVAIGGAGMMGAGALSRSITGTDPSRSITGTDALSRIMGGGAAAPSSEVQFDKNSPMGKLQALGKKLEESGKKMDAAEKSGDTAGQVAAAFDGLGTLLGGGRHVDPVPIDQLRPFVPETFAGLPKTSSNAEKNGFGGLAVSKAEATYSDKAGKSVTLEVSDSGGVSGLVGLAGWAGVQGEKEDDYMSERTQKVGGRLVHEKLSKKGGDNEFGIVLGDRFMVSATGRGVDLNTLKAAVAGMDLGKLESMKDVGVQK